MAYVILTNVLAVVVVLGVMILIHELGHFLAAKYFGIRVEVFSFGFGKRLWGFKKGETDYRVSLLPLGGYVKMAGENPDEAPPGGRHRADDCPPGGPANRSGRGSQRRATGPHAHASSGGPRAIGLCRL